jgi:hypothetical protein
MRLGAWVGLPRPFPQRQACSTTDPETKPSRSDKLHARRWRRARSCLVVS